jgi:hypothetical protein
VKISEDCEPFVVKLSVLQLSEDGERYARTPVLWLVSACRDHEPVFALLRIEVRMGCSAKKKERRWTRRSTSSLKSGLYCVWEECFLKSD